MSASAMKLYGYWRSSATWRVRIALAYKGLTYEYVPVNLRKGPGEQNTDDYRAINPMRQVPALEVDEDEERGGRRVRLMQSLAIVEYLEERWPAPPLLPAERLARARVRQIAEMFNAGIQPLQNTGVQLYLDDVLRVDSRSWVRHWVTRGLDAVERTVRETAGRFAVGDEVTVADLCIVPQLFFCRRFAIDESAYPTLVRIDATCAELPAFQRAHAERQPDAEP
jgi:maleylpyruvate isomerase